MFLLLKCVNPAVPPTPAVFCKAEHAVLYYGKTCLENPGFPSQLQEDSGVVFLFGVNAFHSTSNA